MRNCLVVIPAYNERGYIFGVVKDLQRVGFVNILIVDDGSGDETAAGALMAGAKVVRHPANMGVGAALRTGFDYAIKHEYKFVVTFDGDGQMRADDAVRLLEKSGEGYDFVYGCRNFDIPEVPTPRKLINLFADILTGFLSGKFVWDTQSGLRCIKVDLLKKFDLKSRGYSISSELIIKSVRNGVIPQPVKIDAIYTKESLKKGQKISNSLRVIKELLG